jgi:hypothetical protein
MNATTERRTMSHVSIVLQAYEPGRRHLRNVSQPPLPNAQCGRIDGMVIVFDAGPMAADRMFKRSGSRALLHECSGDRIRVIVPRAVFEEVVRATEGWLQSAKKSLGSARHNLDEAFATPPIVPELDVPALLEQYRQELEDLLLSNNVVIADWKSVEHDEIVERDLARKPPFDESGRGYRDALTWHAIRDLVLNEGERIIFVTKDKDFSDPNDESALHPTLVDELDSDRGAVKIVKDLAEAVRVVGDARNDFAERLTATIEEQSQSIGTLALLLLDDVLPYGLQSSGADAWLNGPEVAEVYEAWGVWSAVVYGQLEFEYTGTLNEVEYEAFFESFSDARYYTNEVAWDDEQRYATVDGGGTVNVALGVTYDPEEDSLDVTSAMVVDVESATAEVQNE